MISINVKQFKSQYKKYTVPFYFIDNYNRLLFYVKTKVHTTF